MMFLQDGHLSRIGSNVCWAVSGDGAERGVLINTYPRASWPQCHLGPSWNKGEIGICSPTPQWEFNKYEMRDLAQSQVGVHYGDRYKSE